MAARVPLFALLVVVLAAAAFAVPSRMDRRREAPSLPDRLKPSDMQNSAVRRDNANAEGSLQGDLPTSPAPLFEKEPESEEEMLAHPCTTHGTLTEQGTCHCEEGFTGLNCEQVIIAGQMKTLEGHGFPNCTVKVYDSRLVNELNNLIAEGKCDENGIYHFPAPHRHVYVLSLRSMHGTETRGMYTVPSIRSRRDLRNRNRRSHVSFWYNVLVSLPEILTGEMWWIATIWGYDHDIGTCDLNIGVYAPHFYNQLMSTIMPQGCIGDSFFFKENCYDESNWFDHSVEPMGSWDHSCENFEYGEEYLWLFETDRNRFFEIFVYNSLWNSPTGYAQGDYDRWRHPYLPDWNPFWTWGYESLFAHVHIYKAGEGGYTELVQIIDVVNSTNSTLRPGLYWHVATLEVNTIPENIYMDAPANGSVHEVNTVSCNPASIWGYELPAMRFEMPYKNNWRGMWCNCTVDNSYLQAPDYACYVCDGICGTPY